MVEWVENKILKKMTIEWDEIGSEDKSFTIEVHAIERSFEFWEHIGYIEDINGKYTNFRKEIKIQ